MAKLKMYVNGAWVEVANGVAGGGGGEPALGNPAVTGYVLSSTTAGVRSWVAQASGSFTTDFAIKMSANQTIANLTTTKVNKFDTIVRDNNSEWDAGNLRWLCATSGTYIINASIFWAAKTTGYRIIYIYVDGALAQSETYTGFSVATSARITVAKALTAGQYMEIYARQNCGGNLDIIATPGGGTAHEWQIWRIQ